MTLIVQRSDITHGTVLEGNIVRLEVNVSERRLKRRAGRPGSDEGPIVVGCNKENGRLCIVCQASTNISSIPDMYERFGSRSQSRICRKLSLFSM
jgi:hypothetical protein